jgi:hypothetical protein
MLVSVLALKTSVCCPIARAAASTAVRSDSLAGVNRMMYGHETIEELEVETFERPRRLHLVRENRGMHYERALKR